MSKQLALLGGNPVFEKSLNQGQGYLPAWDKFTTMIDGIFTRKYYTNHGPLSQKLEKELSYFFGVKHSICMTNTGIGLMIAAKALDLKGKVVMPAFSHISLSQAVIWAGLKPIFCDVKKDTFHIDTDLLNTIIDNDTSAVLGVNLFGGTCDFESIENIASKFSIKHYYLSDDAIGEQYKKNKISNFGNLEIFSLHESKLINATDACVITTNDDFIAARLRNIRSSYGSGPPVPIAFTGNGRMSEVQGGMALLSLEDSNNNIKLNREVVELYESYLRNKEGISIYEPGSFVSNRNYHRLIIKVDESEFGISAAKLSRILYAENIIVNTFTNYALNPFLPFNSLTTAPNALDLSQSLIELPIGNKEITKPAVEKICDVINQVVLNINKINNLLND